MEFKECAKMAGFCSTGHIIEISMYTKVFLAQLLYLIAALPMAAIFEQMKAYNKEEATDK